MSLKAPYNFVPLNKNVVTPHWASYVNHDLPFKDAQSGYLEIELKTHSPLYVRNGVPGDPEKKNPESLRFNHHQGKYFIPGSSLKGMLRSVLEIMSFGRITDKMDDVMLAQRDFSNPTIYEKEKFAKEIQCGWLRKMPDETYCIKDCEKPGRITHEELSLIAKIEGSRQTISAYYQQSNLKFNDKYVKSAKSKYDLFFAGKSPELFHFGEDTTDKQVGLKKYVFSRDGRKGRIVLTGQPSKFDPKATGPRRAKHSEFIFFEPKSSSALITVQEQIIANLKVAYFDGEDEGPDWKWRKKQLEEGEEIPVFFRWVDKDKKEMGIKDMGLAFLYKMAYNHSTTELAQHKRDDAKPDLADTIFGYVPDEKNALKKPGIRTLKGRVQIGHAFVDGNAEQMETVTEVLAGPKATYYPTYIRQYGGTYRTYNDKNAEISGWKRYPIRSNGVVSHTTLPTRGDGTINTEVGSTFTPLKKHATSRFRINYHNLRKEELGALISAITFHNTANTYHSLGLAKPLGYGKVSLNIQNLDPERRTEYLKAFEGFMRFKMENWHKSEQLRELIGMAMEKATEAKTGYMSDPKEFAAAKDKKVMDYLRKHSEIYDFTPSVVPLLDDSELARTKTFYETEIEHWTPKALSENVIENRKKSYEADLTLIKLKLKSLLRNRQAEVFKLEEQEKREEHAKLREQQAELQRLEEHKQREERMKKALEEGPDFTKFKVDDKNALNLTRYEMVRYGTKARSCSKDSLSGFKDGYALDTHHTIIIEHFTALYLSLSNKDKIAWKKDNSEARKYLRQWIGPDKAGDVFTNLP